MMKKHLLLITVFLGIYFTSFTQKQVDPFYVYGPGQDEVFIDFNRASKKAGTVTKLKCHNVDLSQEFRKLKRFNNLYVLSLLKNNLDSLPSELFFNRNLLYFETSNPLVNLPPNLDEASGLKHVKIYHSNIFTIPKSFQKLRSLQTFEMQVNTADSTDMDSCFHNLSRLEDIFLFQVNLKGFPRTLESCSSLEALSIIDCGLTSLDSCSLGLPQIKKLNLSRNKIEQIDKCILNCTNLEELTLSNNQLTELPEFLHYLNNLRLIDVSGNDIPIRDITILRILMPGTRIIY